MNKRWLAILAGVLAFFVVLGVGMLAGGTLAYVSMRARPVQAALALQGATPDSNSGILVADVASDGPAAQAGVVRGDILMSLNDQTLNTLQDLQTQLANAKPGDVVSISVLHGDETRNLSVTLGDNNGTAYLGIVPCLTGARNMGQYLPNPNQKGQSVSGTVITQVITDGPADKAGLQTGDVILAVDGQELDSSHTLGDLIQAHQPNDTVTLSVQKAGASEASDVQVTLGDNPDTPGKAYLGVYYANGTNQNRRTPFFQNPQNPGNGGNGQTQPFGNQPFGQMMPELPNGVSQAVVVGEVVSGSPADKAGLQADDIITAIDGQQVNDAQALVDAVSAHKPGDSVALTVYRSGQSDSQTITVTLGENPDRAGAAYMGVNIGTLSSNGLPPNHPAIPSTPAPDNNNGSTIPNWPGGGDA